MSRAFVSEKETWEYCPKAGERCIHASADRECTRRECEHFQRKPQPADSRSTAARGPATRTVVRAGRSVSAEKKASGRSSGPAPSKEKASGRSSGVAPSKKGPSRSSATKRSALKKPVKWGGRSGGSW